MNHEYSIKYTVQADTKLAAIEAAVAKLRSSMRLVAVVSADPSTRPWWVVRLRIWEDA
jgi:predicted RNA-binding protein with PIN domain